MSDSSEIFSRVRSAVNIVDVIGEHVALKRAGREFKGLCPFHEDHRPSMAVVPHKQIFHCFVCGTGGDVFKFVMNYHKMSAGEALRMLAQRAGIKLPELPGRGGTGPTRDKDGLTPRERISNTNEWACAWFEKQLRLPQGKPGLDYLHSRGLTDETIAKFRLGFAPEGWTNLVNDALRSQTSALSTQHLAEAGLIKQRNDSSPYDAFRNRVIFPIIDATGGAGGSGAAKQSGGRVIAFGGRILEEKRDEAGNIVEAKYLNSPDTKLFNKSESLYGINLARQHIIRTRTAIVVEGYMDVIACHQAGVTNVIATLGTALTPDHARILKNYAQTIVLVFDSDDAGRRAADRALEVFVRGTTDIKLTNVPDGKDPCDFCIKNGGELFQKLVEHATDALTYKWQQLQTQFHATDSLSARQEAITIFLRFVAAALDVDHSNTGSAIDPVRRGLLLTKIASLVNMPLPDLQQTLKNLARQNRPPSTNSGVASGTASPGATPADASEAPLDTPQIAHVDVRTLKGLSAAEGWLLGALLTRPPMYETLRDQVSLSLFETFHALAAALIEYFDNHGEMGACSLAELAAYLEESHLGGSQLVRQAIELESLAADWLEPANLSPIHAKMLLNLTADRGVTLESVAHDALRELQQARWGGNADPALAEEFDALPEEPAPTLCTDDAALKELQALVTKKAAPSLRNTNFPA
jgi:DNA primase